MNFDKSVALQKKRNSIIPGGGHTYAKSDDQYPEHAPLIIEKGKGCRVWDIDGNEFIEYGMGLRAVTLGHAYEPVIRAAYRQMLLGENYTRPARIELELAEIMVNLMDGPEMVKFAKNGSDVTTAAVKLARAFTGRDRVAICSTHPFFSADDWFIGTTSMSAGIPKAISDLTVKFDYNNPESLKTLFERHPGEIACVVMEPATSEEPIDNFLQNVRNICHANGTVLVFDEMITGFRFHLGGGQKYYGVEPDLSTFGKAMGNGFSVSALMGDREIMERGGLHHDKERVFLLSLTHGAENHALAAAKETIHIYKTHDVIGHLKRQGERLAAGIRKAASENRVGEFFHVMGHPANLIYVTLDEEKGRSQAYRTLFLQEIIKRGVIAPSLVVSYSHTDAEIDRTVGVINDALVIYRKALDEGIGKYLKGRPVKPVFRKYN